jgi:hypothetical protein
MATLLPPPSKKAKLAQATDGQIDLSEVTGNILCRFQASDTGEFTGTTVQIPLKTTVRELELLLNQLLNNVSISLICIVNSREMTHYLTRSLSILNQVQ